MANPAEEKEGMKSSTKIMMAICAILVLLVLCFGVVSWLDTPSKKTNHKKPGTSAPAKNPFG